MNLFLFEEEILEMILKLVLVQNGPIQLPSYQPNRRVLETCREMYKRGCPIFYTHNIFSVSTANINVRDRWSHKPLWSDASLVQPVQFLRYLALDISKWTDIPRLFTVLEGCVHLRRLYIVIHSAPENYFEVITPIWFQIPPDLELVRVVGVECISLFKRDQEQERTKERKSLYEK
jgi:hypothetical protein